MKLPPSSLATYYLSMRIPIQNKAGKSFLDLLFMKNDFALFVYIFNKFQFVVKLTIKKSIKMKSGSFFYQLYVILTNDDSLHVKTGRGP